MGAIYRVGIVGLGGISRIHARSAFDSQKAELCAACDVSQEAVDRFVVEFELKRGYLDLEEMLRSEDLDIAIVCTWGPLHAEVSNRIARSGSVQAILCEKPISQSAQDSQAMFATALDNGVLLAEALKSLHHPLNLKAKELLDGGAIGRLTAIRGTFTSARPVERCTPTASWRYNRNKGGGIVYDLGCYVLNHARSLAGVDPERVYATASYGDEVEFDVAAVLNFPNGAVAQLTFSWLQHPSQYLEIAGTEGEIRVDPAFNNENQKTRLLVQTRDATESFEFQPVDPFVLQLDHLCDCLDSGIPHRITPDHSVGTMKTIDAIHESIRKGQAVDLA